MERLKVHLSRQQGVVLGIDVGYSATRKTTGFCALSWGDDKVTWQCENTSTTESDRRACLARLLNGRTRVWAVAIDGPLRPHLSSGTSYRACESCLSRGAFQRRGKPGASSSPSGQSLHTAATALAMLTLDSAEVVPAKHVPSIHSRAIVEAFPTLFLGVMCDVATYPPKTRRWTDALYPVVQPKLAQLLGCLFPGHNIQWPWAPLGHEQIASLVCALTALCVLNRRFVAVGDADDGYIVLPPPAWWGRDGSGRPGWAWTELAAHLPNVRRRFPGAVICKVG